MPLQGLAIGFNLALATRSLSGLGIVGCNLAAAVHFSPAFCPIAMAMGLQTRQKLSSLGPNFASTPQARQAPSAARCLHARPVRLSWVKADVIAKPWSGLRALLMSQPPGTAPGGINRAPQPCGQVVLKLKTRAG